MTEMKIMKAELVGRRHPDYTRMKPHWDFLEATYRGGRGWFAENIFRYFKEGEKEYRERVQRGYRFNHTREIVNLVTKYVFKGEIKRGEDAPDQVRSFWKRATRRGEPIETLMRETSRSMSAFGSPYMVVDSTLPASAQGRRLSRAEAERLGARVFAYVVKPQNALDMSFDDKGELNWILLYEEGRDDADFWTGDVFRTYEYYKLWTRQEWFTFRRPRAEGAHGSKDDAELVNQGRHGLGFVPVMQMRETDSDDEYSAPALIDDIAYLDRAVANYLSNLDAIIQDQTFSQLAIPAQNIPAGEDDYHQILEMGTKRIFVYDGEGGKGPAYIAPDPRQAGIILQVITKIITEIYHSVGMAGERTKMDNAAGIDNSSGVAKAYDFDRMDTMLKAKADRLEAVENWLARTVMAWHGRTLEDNIVTYPESFDTRDLYDEFEIAERFALLQAPQKLRQHQITTLVDKLYPQLRRDLRAKILREVEGWGDPLAMMEMVQQGLQEGAGGGFEPDEDPKQGQNNKDVREE